MFVNVALFSILCVDCFFEIICHKWGFLPHLQHFALFYWSYTSSKDKLPDAGSEYEGFGGTIKANFTNFYTYLFIFKDAIEFVLQNFGEMNKLWVLIVLLIYFNCYYSNVSRFVCSIKGPCVINLVGEQLSYFTPYISIKLNSCLCFYLVSFIYLFIYLSIFMNSEKERRNLRQLVGLNLVRLSGLFFVYRSTFSSYHVIFKFVSLLISLLYFYLCLILFRNAWRRCWCLPGYYFYFLY